jgi:hypothetical protein
LDIHGKFRVIYESWHKIKQKKSYLNSIKNLFLKAFFLEDYVKHSKVYFNDLVESYPITDYYLLNPTKELENLETSISSIRTEIELDYSNKNQISSSRAVRQLRNLV